MTGARRIPRPRVSGNRVQAVAEQLDLAELVHAAQHGRGPPRFGADDLHDGPRHARLDARRGFRGHEAAASHEAHPGCPLGFVQVGCRHDDGDPFLQEPGEDDPELPPRHRVHAGGRLVQEDHAGAMDERARQGKLLFHPAGQPIRQPPAEGDEAREGEQLVASFLETFHAVDPRKELDVLVHREIAVQAEPLRQVADTVLDPGRIAGSIAAEELELFRRRERGFRRGGGSS